MFVLVHEKFQNPRTTFEIPRFFLFDWNPNIYVNQQSIQNFRTLGHLLKFPHCPAKYSIVWGGKGGPPYNFRLHLWGTMGMAPSMRTIDISALPSFIPSGNVQVLCLHTCLISLHGLSQRFFSLYLSSTWVSLHGVLTHTKKTLSYI